MPDRYQGLRDAIAAGPVTGERSVIHNSWETSTVYVDGWPIAKCVIDPRVTEETQYELEPIKEANAAHIAAADPDTIAALLKERDALRKALLQLAYIEPVRGVSPTALVGAATVEWNVHVIARAALADGEAQS